MGRSAVVYPPGWRGAARYRIASIAMIHDDQYARELDRAYRFAHAAFDGDLRSMKTLAVQLSEAIARKKFAKAAKAAVRTFVDFIDPRHPGAAVYAAAQENRLEAMRLLHELRADLDKPNTVDGASPAYIAASKGNTAMVHLLHDLGADVHRVAKRGDRPIHASAHTGQEKTVLLLLSLRAIVDQQDNNDAKTPLLCAVGGGSLSTTKLLLTLRASTNHCDSAGLSALDVATRYSGSREIVDLVRQHSRAVVRRWDRS